MCLSLSTFLPLPPCFIVLPSFNSPCPILSLLLLLLLSCPLTTSFSLIPFPTPPLIPLISLPTPLTSPPYCSFYSSHFSDYSPYFSHSSPLFISSQQSASFAIAFTPRKGLRQSLKATVPCKY